MKSGSTGWSTGPHLHFEVRVNGIAVDSLPYITANTEKKSENNKANNEINITNNTITNNTENQT